MKKEMEDKEYKKYLFKLCMIENIVTIICFTILSIVFNNFLLIFISVLFMRFVKDKEKEEE